MRCTAFPLCVDYSSFISLFFFFFNDTAPTEIYTLSLHDALPISPAEPRAQARREPRPPKLGNHEPNRLGHGWELACSGRSEEQTSELQSHLNIVFRLLL